MIFIAILYDVMYTVEGFFKAVRYKSYQNSIIEILGNTSSTDDDQICFYLQSFISQTNHHHQNHFKVVISDKVKDY